MILTGIKVSVYLFFVQVKKEGGNRHAITVYNHNFMQRELDLRKNQNMYIPTKNPHLRSP